MNRPANHRPSPSLATVILPTRQRPLAKPASPMKRLAFLIAASGLVWALVKLFPLL